MNTINIYVGCALKHAPKAFVDEVLALRAELEKYPRFTVLKFLGRGEPRDIYIRDIKECIAQADVMLAVADLPSTGLGYEMATHYEKNGRPLLIVAHPSADVSGLILGIHGTAPIEVRQYGHLSQVPEIFIDWLGRIPPSFLLRNGSSQKNSAFQHPAFLPGTASR